jgi:hypothetical protein
LIYNITLGIGAGGDLLLIKNLTEAQAAGHITTILICNMETIGEWRHS